MAGASGITVLKRRDLLVGAGTAAAILALGGVALAAGPEAAKADAASLYDQALDKILGDIKPGPGKITFELPEIAENGNTVPYTITVDSPMTDADRVVAIHVLASANPMPNVASFKLSRLSGKATVSSRMRLAKTQNVVVLAEFTGAKFVLAQRAVKVTIGGCGG